MGFTTMCWNSKPSTPAGIPRNTCRWKKQSSGLPVGQRTRLTGRLASHSRSMAEDEIRLVGFARSLPAMVGAEPCAALSCETGKGDVHVVGCPAHEPDRLFGNTAQTAVA